MKREGECVAVIKPYRHFLTDKEDKMFLDPETIVPYIPTIAAQLLNVVYERVALTGGDPEKEDTLRKEEEVVLKQWENLMFRLNTTTDKIRERGRT